MRYFHPFKCFTPINRKSTCNSFSSDNDIHSFSLIILYFPLYTLKVRLAEKTPKSSITKQYFFGKQEPSLNYTRRSLIIFTSAKKFTNKSFIKQVGPVFFVYIQKISICLVNTNLIETTYLLNDVVHQPFTM